MKDIDVSKYLSKMHAVLFICLGFNNCAFFETLSPSLSHPLPFSLTTSFVTAWRRHLLPFLLVYIPAQTCHLLAHNWINDNLLISYSIYNDENKFISIRYIYIYIYMWHYCFFLQRYFNVYYEIVIVFV